MLWVPAAGGGRVDHLFVAVSPQRWGKCDDQTQRVKVREQPHAGDHDSLDLAAKVPGGRSLAAVFRY